MTAFDLVIKCTIPEAFDFAPYRNAEVEISAKYTAEFLKKDIAMRRILYAKFVESGQINSGSDL